MATDIKTNWMKDFNGDLFAPKTLMDSVQDVDGTKLKEYIEQHSGGGSGDISASQYETFFDNIIVINNIAPFVMPAMTSDIYTDAEGFIFKTSASSVFSNSDVPNGKAYRPFDGTTARGPGDCWHPTSGSPQWLLLELPYLVSIKKFTLKNRENYVEGPNYIIFQGSNDGKTFEDIVDFYFPSGSNQSLTIEIESNNYYKYYRWYESSVYNYGVISKIIIDEAYRMEE